MWGVNGNGVIESFEMASENVAKGDSNFLKDDDEKGNEENEVGLTYVVVRNIPGGYHSSDLRDFFSQLVESGGFDCFHFKHRPEIKTTTTTTTTENEEEKVVMISSSNVSDEEDNNSRRPSSSATATTRCCVCRVKGGEKRLLQLFRMYHGKHWLDGEGQTLPLRCFIAKIKLRKEEAECETSNEEEPPLLYKTRGEWKRIPVQHVQREGAEQRGGGGASVEELNALPEFRPPAHVMPQGNVGTPTAHFHALIRTCAMPSRLIGRLRLHFVKHPAMGTRRYASVPFTYKGTSVTPKHEDDGDEEEEVKTASGHVLSDVHFARPRSAAAAAAEEGPSSSSAHCPEEAAADEDGDEDDDDDTCEEWERHESLHDDVTSQGRTKERLYEEEIELKWEKGGSGLVFYTDAQVWDAREGDFDERTADDWDVDVSPYYEKNAGDMDSRALVTMRREGLLRSGVQSESAFCAKPNPGRRGTKDGGGGKTRIGRFERHTKGIGRKLLEGRGWEEGKGLGRNLQGISHALDADEAQHPKEKKGFGYHGEKLVRFGNPGNRKRLQQEVVISTVYDDPEVVDPPEVVLRRRETTLLKHRRVGDIRFKKETQ